MSHTPAPVALDTLTVTEVSKRFGLHRAVARVSFACEAGKPCALLGGNGAGKSTLLGMLSTLVQPSAGKISYSTEGSPAPGGEALRRQIGVLAHDSFIYSELTGIENLRFYGRLYGLGDVEARAQALLDEVALGGDARDRIARTYSRGMLQRLALARAMLHQPRVLLLDEPFTGLDRTGIAALGRTLCRAKEERRIVVVVTHDLEAIAGLAEQVVVLRRGKLVCNQRSAEGFSHADLVGLYHQFSE